MANHVFFIHTVSGVVDLFKSLARELLPQAKVAHVADDGLIQQILAAGGLTPAIYRRVCDHVVAAEEAEADVIQLTCSSISPCVEVARHLVSVPLLKIDEPMADQAVDSFPRVGVIATNPATLGPSADLVRERARALGRAIQVDSVLCDGAYPAFLAGDMRTHDEIVLGHLRDLMKRVDGVLLAQASMARLAEGLDGSDRRVPVLSSPRPAMERLARLLRGLADS